MLLQLFIVIAAVALTVKIVRELVKIEIADRLMQCPQCRSNLIYPETDAVWSCANCGSTFSANSII